MVRPPADPLADIETLGGQLDLKCPSGGGTVVRATLPHRLRPRTTRSKEPAAIQKLRLRSAPTRITGYSRSSPSVPKLRLNPLAMPAH